MIRQMISSIVELLKNYYLKVHIKNGLTVGKNVFISHDVFIDPGFPWLISIGDDCTITSGVMLLAHDATTKKHLGYTKIGKINIGNKTFVGARSIILPDITIGENVIIAAGSVVTKDIPSNVLIAGNPARIICSTTDYIEKHRKNIAIRPIYKEGWTINTGISVENKESMKNALTDGIGYVI